MNMVYAKFLKRPISSSYLDFAWRPFCKFANYAIVFEAAIILK